MVFLQEDPAHRPSFSPITSQPRTWQSLPAPSGIPALYKIPETHLSSHCSSPQKLLVTHCCLYNPIFSQLRPGPQPWPAVISLVFTKCPFSFSVLVTPHTFHSSFSSLSPSISAVEIICHKENGPSDRNPSISLSSSSKLTYRGHNFPPSCLAQRKRFQSSYLRLTSSPPWASTQSLLPLPRPCSFVYIFIISPSPRATSYPLKIYPSLLPSEKRVPQIQLPFHALIHTYLHFITFQSLLHLCILASVTVTHLTPSTKVSNDQIIKFILYSLTWSLGRFYDGFCLGLKLIRSHYRHLGEYRKE